MPRYLGYRDVWENCFYSTYGRDRAMRYSERVYCSLGKRRLTHNFKEDQPGVICPDWYRCKGLAILDNQKKGKLH